MKPLEVSAPQPLVQGKAFARVSGLKSTETQVFPARGAAVDDSTERICPVHLQSPLVGADLHDPPDQPHPRLNLNRRLLM